MAIKIDIHFSDFFNVSPVILEEYGAFNISLVNDLPLFIDPFLLFNSSKAEYQALHAEMIRYLRFLRDASRQSGINPGLLQSWYRFPEVSQTWLGYSLVGSRGRGLGNDFAQALHRNLHTIFTDFGAEEITLGSHLERLCLIKDGVGRDNISDFTTNLIKGYLLAYTQTFAQAHIDVGLRQVIWVNKARFNYQTQTWQRGRYELPYYNGDFVLLTPKDILTREDTWINSTDIKNQRVFTEIALSIPNEQLRAEINNYFNRVLARRFEKPNKKEMERAIAQFIKQYPKIIDYYIRYKEDRGQQAVTLSEERVEETETLFITQLVGQLARS
jgi:hypothetical protein